MKAGSELILHAFSHGVWTAHRNDNLLGHAEIVDILGPNSVDVTLCNTFLIPGAQGVVDLFDATTLSWTERRTEIYDLAPGAFVLGAVRERFNCTTPIVMPDGSGLKTFVQMYEGRSTCGRIGLASHITAGFGDYGFSGCFTLELYNHAPYTIRLRAGMRVGQVAFEEVVAPKCYSGAYAGTRQNYGPVAPVLGEWRFKLRTA